MCRRWWRLGRILGTGNRCRTGYARPWRDLTKTIFFGVGEVLCVSLLAIRNAGTGLIRRGRPTSVPLCEMPTLTDIAKGRTSCPFAALGSSSHVYRANRDLVFRRCLSILRDPDEADDVTQDVFLKVLRYSSEGSTPPRALFQRTATHLSLNRVRDLMRRHALVAGVSGADDSSAGRLESRSSLRELSRDVGTPNLEVAILRYAHGLTWNETASQVGLSVSGVRRRLRVLMSIAAERG